MKQTNFNREDARIKKKWEKLVTEFKKVFDYQKNIPLGHAGYYEMGSDARKEFHLTPDLDHEAYNATKLWVLSHCDFNPRAGQIMDSSEEEKGSQMGNIEPIMS